MTRQRQTKAYGILQLLLLLLLLPPAVAVVHMHVDRFDDCATMQSLMSLFPPPLKRRCS
jgi:hypothetical protein